MIFYCKRQQKKMLTCQLVERQTCVPEAAVQTPLESTVFLLTLAVLENHENVLFK